jgi:hypothetical protein
MDSRDRRHVVPHRSFQWPPKGIDEIADHWVAHVGDCPLCLAGFECRIDGWYSRVMTLWSFHAPEVKVQGHA